MEKIRKTMRREDGFTLVELLAVIVILGIILAIAIPAIGNVIADSKSDAKAAENELILDAARLYFTVEKSTENPVSVKKLISTGYLEERGEELTDRSDETVTRDIDTGKVTGSWEGNGDGNEEENDDDEKNNGAG